MRRWTAGAAATTLVGVLGLTAHGSVPRAWAVPAPEVEYVYDVVVRRHFDFPGNDALGYGYGICKRVNAGQSYDRVIRNVEADVMPNDEGSANYVISHAVGILCPSAIWWLRQSAADYVPST